VSNIPSSEISYSEDKPVPLIRIGRFHAFNDSLIKKQILKFIIAGIAGVATDFAVYRFLLRFIQPSPAKAISFVCGTIIVFFTNKYWTYQKNTRSVGEAMKFCVVYGITWGVNVGLNKLMLVIFPGRILWAFLVAVAICTILNFCGQKLWVFK
jgi:putative flippase GtrA